MIPNRIRALFAHTEKIETERLLLRRILRVDTDDMFEYAQDPEVSRYLLWYPHPNRNHTFRYIVSLENRYRSGEICDFAVILKESGKMIGTCGFSAFDFTNNCAEIGYVMNPRYEHHGYMTEAVNAVLRFGFEKVGFHRIEAVFMKENRRSLAVMERCHMVFEGYRREGVLVKGKYETCGVAAILENEFQKKKDL